MRTLTVTTISDSGLRVGQRVRVHVNLHRGDFSVAEPRTGTVITNVDDIVLTDVTFRHQPKCVERVVARNRRKVCAYAVGRVAEINTSPDVTDGREVSYNPFRREDFHRKDTGETVTHADLVVFIGKRAYTSA